MKKTKDAKNQLRRAQRPASGESTSYASWIVELKRRYRATQIKAAVAVNSALIEFYWNLGKDISEKYVGTKIYGSGFFSRLSADLKGAIPGADGLSTQNLRYCLHFYELYGGAKILPQLVGKLVCIPWGHHRIIIDKCKGDRLLTSGLSGGNERKRMEPAQSAARRKLVAKPPSPCPDVDAPASTFPQKNGGRPEDRPPACSPYSMCTFASMVAVPPGVVTWKRRELPSWTPDGPSSSSHA